jgi:hypothetical protein
MFRMVTRARWLNGPIHERTTGGNRWRWFGGLYCACVLEGVGTRITIIDRQNPLFQPLLYRSLPQHCHRLMPAPSARS